MPENQELEALFQKLGQRKPSSFARKSEYLVISPELTDQARILAERFETTQGNVIPFRAAIVVFLNNRFQAKGDMSARGVACACLATRHISEGYAGEIVTKDGYYPRIEIAPRYAKLYPWDVEKVLLHELCHFAPGVYGHGKLFHFWMEKMGASRHTPVLPTRFRPHVYRHDRCGYTQVYTARLSSELSNQNFCPTCMNNLIVEPLAFYGSYNYELDIIVPAHDDSRSEATLREMGQP
jgi:hypothetical protein